MTLETGLKLAGKTILSLKRYGVKVTAKKVMNKLYCHYVLSNELASPDLRIAHGVTCMYQDNKVERVKDIDIKALAFYLPQFHTFPENDEWWGKGFTEWTNTRKSTPRYWKHYQPREPHDDIGYYDLTDVDTIKNQAKLAKEHGIYGFCMYYYWFSGKTLMEKPLEILLSHPEIDTNYCLCWANESWTRAWDGWKENVLIEQKYDDGDAEKFIKDISKYWEDKRYIRHNGMPVVIVYNPGDIPNIKEVLERWQKKAEEMGIGKISIWICRSFRNTIDSLGIDDLVDKEIEFPPHNFADLPIIRKNSDELVENANLLDYSYMVDYLSNEKNVMKKNQKLCRTVMLGWDNSARRDTGFNVFDNFNIEKYHKWLRVRIDETRQYRKPEDRYVFINAWNEWAEGTYLEPDRRYGYAYLNVTTQALQGKEFSLETVVQNNDGKTSARIAVQAHVFYAELIDEIIRYMNNIPEAYDCYITTDNACKAEKILEALRDKCSARKSVVTVYENKGRDVGPFLMQLQGIANSYDYICHVHSKRSKHDVFGEKWRSYLFVNLLGSPKGIEDIINTFDNDEKLGLIYPNTFWHVLGGMEWGADKSIMSNLFRMIQIKAELGHAPIFPAGDMLWFRSKAVQQLFDNNISWDDFPEEKGQLDGTIMHAVERAWVYVAKANGYTYKNMNISPVNQ